MSIVRAQNISTDYTATGNNFTSQSVTNNPANTNIDSYTLNTNAFLRTVYNPNSIQATWVKNSVSWRIDDLQHRMQMILDDLAKLNFEASDYNNRLDYLERHHRRFSALNLEDDTSLANVHHRRHHPLPPPPPSPPHRTHSHQENQIRTLEAQMRQRGLDFVHLENKFERVDKRLIRLEDGYMGSAFNASHNLVNEYPGSNLELRLNQLERNMLHLEWRVKALLLVSRDFEFRIQDLEFGNIS